MSLLERVNDITQAVNGAVGNLANNYDLSPADKEKLIKGTMAGKLEVKGPGQIAASYTLSEEQLKEVKNYFSEGTQANIFRLS